MAWSDIFGFCDFEQFYKDSVRDAAPGDVMVEVGVMLGRSACLLSSLAVDADKGLDIYAVDPWETDEGWGEKKRGLSRNGRCYTSALMSMLLNASEALDAMSVLRLTSVSAARIFEDKTVGFVFIDGSHAYSSVKQDIAAWLPKIRPGGVLAGHDYTHPTEKGVAQAVNEMLGPKVESIGTSGGNGVWRVRR